MKKLDIIKSDNVLMEVVLGESNCECSKKRLDEKTADSSTEKHVPYIRETEEGYLVKVGKNTQHPMVEEHYIQFIELIVDDIIHRKYLKQTDKAEVLFKVEKGTVIIAREYCNLHGLWKSTL